MTVDKLEAFVIAVGKDIGALQKAVEAKADKTSAQAAGISAEELQQQMDKAITDYLMDDKKMRALGSGLASPVHILVKDKNQGKIFMMTPNALRDLSTQGMLTDGTYKVMELIEPSDLTGLDTVILQPETEEELKELVLDYEPGMLIVNQSAGPMKRLNVLDKEFQPVPIFKEFFEQKEKLTALEARLAELEKGK